MCGRFTLTALDLEAVAGALGVPWLDPDLARAWKPHYNVAPTQPHPVLRIGKDGTRQLDALSWGLKGFPRGERRTAPFTLARAETVATSSAFRDAFRTRRCVVPVDGFYEWGGEGRAREPHWFSAPGEEGRPALLRLAGIWEGRRSDGSARFAILTVPATGAPAGVHDRMPALLSAGEVGAYLGGAMTANDLAGSADEGARTLADRTVSRRVNSADNDDAACLDPAGPWSDLPLFVSPTVVTKP